MDNPTVNAVEGRGLHIAHLNVRSLLGGHSFEMLKNQVESSKFNLFTVSESWLTEAVPDKSVEFSGYELIRLDRAWSDNTTGGSPKRGGGVACYIKKEIIYSDSKFKHLNTSSKDLEMLWVSVSIPNVRPIVVVTVYRPPQGNIKTCCDAINLAFDKAGLKDNTDIFLLGDFNVNFDDRKGQGFRELDFTTQAIGLRQQIQTPTRLSQLEDRSLIHKFRLHSCLRYP